MRDKIISEIQRLSAKHGKTIGRELFEKETAIGASAWLGVYWARWGDALKDAGFEPNAKTAKIDSDFYFQRLAAAFRHYGKIPTTAELRLYRNIDRTLPTHSTLEKTFGTKDGMLRQLKAWVSNKPEYADISDLLSDLPAPADDPISPPAKDGWVYLLKYGEFHKIGAGSDLEKRVKQVATKLPADGELIHAIRTDDPFGIEAYWHRRFADKRSKNNSEFFKLTPMDVRAMKRRRFQ